MRFFNPLSRSRTTGSSRIPADVSVTLVSLSQLDVILCSYRPQNEHKPSCFHARVTQHFLAFRHFIVLFIFFLSDKSGESWKCSRSVNSAKHFWDGTFRHQKLNSWNIRGFTFKLVINMGVGGGVMGMGGVVSLSSIIISGFEHAASLVKPVNT